jgi:hypothetical protein
MSRKANEPIPVYPLYVSAQLPWWGDTYGHGDKRIGPTRCALIDGVLGDRCSRGRVYRTLRHYMVLPHTRVRQPLPVPKPTTCCELS